MDARVLGFFDDKAMAMRAVDQLSDMGINRSDVDLLSGDEMNLNESQMAPKRSLKDRSLMQKIEDFFTGTKDYDLRDDERDVYAEGIRRGGYLVSVQCDESRVDDAIRVLNECGAADIDRRSEYLRETGWTGYNANAPMFSETERDSYRTQYADWETNRFGKGSAEKVIPVIEEKVNVGKQAFKQGGVRILTRVTETPIDKDVTLRSEHVDVQRRPVDRPVNAADMAAFKEGEIELTESAERAVVNKEARVVEEVEVRKNVEEKVEKVRETARRTDVDVQRLAKEDRNLKSTDRPLDTDRPFTT